MARNAVRRTSGGEGDGHEGAEGDETQQVEGGAPGLPTADSGAQPNPETRITRPGDMVVGDVRDAKSEGAPQAKKYTVVNGGKILWQNLSYQMQPGQVVSDHTHDVALLRRQGIRLEELPADPAEG